MTVTVRSLLRLGCSLAAFGLALQFGSCTVGDPRFFAASTLAEAATAAIVATLAGSFFNSLFGQA
ncbi:MAG TPA: hypothetical protein PKC49_05670 [Phycisphaerae bacterium]|jgi:hypothetical protein|nr:hypothetical protein [Phycisphaerae bacterium]